MVQQDLKLHGLDIHSPRRYTVSNWYILKFLKIQIQLSCSLGAAVMYEDWVEPHLIQSEAESGVSVMKPTIPLVALFFHMIFHSRYANCFYKSKNWATRGPTVSLSC